MTSPSRPDRTARILLLVAFTVVSLEALVLLVIATLAIADGNLSGAGTGVFLGVYGLAQVWAAWQVLGGHSWARSPLVVTNIIQVVVAVTQSGVPLVLTALLVLAGVTVLACLLLPPVTRALSEDGTV